ncbi:hypothetical protein CGLO_10706 [Colletotrichum gloeosporioides Cg-14]|uniref:RecA family profile 1 domain-containing protein n=1 Tax=Colletotrichum gloeosporioides (strain Cg-14) TaxID=1237896 RepID=T0K2S4_COLGC|nr:hypothetical protein CGLO_10706 [Colletotrichum gloeosporioides Cg-14]
MENNHAFHEEDISSFDLPSTHRLPTVSAAQVLEDLDDDLSRHISTGIKRLDEALNSDDSVDTSGSKRSGGILRGQVTEVWGPPGTGKTALGIQLVASALREGQGAVWIAPIRSAGKDSQRLPHLVALLCRPAAATIPTSTALVVIDSLSALVNHAFPKAPDGPSLSAKRLQALQYIVGALQKLAATRNCAVVVLSQCATKMQSERSPTLIPSINAGVWEQGVSTRVVLFKDWVWKDSSPSSVSFAGVQKLDGKAEPDTMQSAAAFRVEAAGLIGVHYDTSQPSILLSRSPRTKRKLAEAGLEVPDSEDDEEYGWEREDDAALPGMPPQWQGSEDLLLGTQAESDDEDGDGSGGDDGDKDDEAEDVEDQNG